MVEATQIAYRAALEWYIDQGVEGAWADESCDRMKPLVASPTPLMPLTSLARSDSPASPVLRSQGQEPLRPSAGASSAPPVFLGTSEARAEAVALASAASTLEELRSALQNFEGLSLKGMASNLVFSEGNAQAPVMLIGEAPAAQDDREGRPFRGEAGILMDKILASIGLDRQAEKAQNSVYLTNLLNWRPPGNRTPTAGEIELSLIFLERHIALVQPRILLICGRTPARALLGLNKNMSALRKQNWHNYTSKAESGEDISIPALVTYAPEYLLQTPGQKRAVWEDMLSLKERL